MYDNRDHGLDWIMGELYEEVTGKSLQKRNYNTLLAAMHCLIHSRLAYEEGNLDVAKGYRRELLDLLPSALLSLMRDFPASLRFLKVLRDIPDREGVQVLLGEKMRLREFLTPLKKEFVDDCAVEIYRSVPRSLVLD